MTATGISFETPSILEDLAHPDQTEDTSLMLQELALCLLGELALIEEDKSTSIISDAFKSLALVTCDTAALAESATFAKPEESERVTAGTVRNLEMSTTSAHPPDFPQFNGLDDPPSTTFNSKSPGSTLNE